MKKSLLAVMLILSTSTVFAQTAYQVCQNVARVSQANGNLCFELIAKNSFDSGALSLAQKVLPLGTHFTVKVLRATANRRVETSASEICEKIALSSGTNTVHCAKTIADNHFSSELLKVASKVNQLGTNFTVSTLKAGTNSYFFGPLAEVCEIIASISGQNTVVCVEAIANKVSINQSEQVCRASLFQGTAYTIACLRNIVMDYKPTPQRPVQETVDTYLLQELKRSLLKSRGALDRGLIDASKRALDEAIQIIDEIMAPAPLEEISKFKT